MSGCQAPGRAGVLLPGPFPFTYHGVGTYTRHAAPYSNAPGRPLLFFFCLFFFLFLCFALPISFLCGAHLIAVSLVPFPPICVLGVNRFLCHCHYLPPFVVLVRLVCLAFRVFFVFLVLFLFIIPRHAPGRSDNKLTEIPTIKAIKKGRNARPLVVVFNISLASVSLDLPACFRPRPAPAAVTGPRYNPAAIPRPFPHKSY